MSKKNIDIRSTNIMIQGTGSNVGKSLLTAAFCRIFKDEGFKVAPFKSQNMALNSFVTKEGGEMGRAQAVQAEACGVEPHTDMNPILLKPTADKTAEVIIDGKVYGDMDAVGYHDFKKKAMASVAESYRRLSSLYEVVVIEGAGSPAEINLRENDIANMGTAHMADAPVILVGDIDKGGVFASLVGTLELLDEADRGRIKGFIINKFRGDVELLRPGLDELEKRTGLPVLGVVPYFHDIFVQEEDSLSAGSLDFNSVNLADGAIDVAVISLPHMSNFSDFDPFYADPFVNLRFIRKGQKIGSPDVLIIPGTKSTIADLRYLKEFGYDEAIQKYVDGGGTLVGICGGYQIMGCIVSDPEGVESEEAVEEKGLSYFDITTVMREGKHTVQVEAEYKEGLPFFIRGMIEGYEIHSGVSEYGEGGKPLFVINGKGDGAVSSGGRVWGTYIHGIFDNDDFRRAFVMSKLGGVSEDVYNDAQQKFLDLKEEGYRKLASVVKESVDMDKVREIMGIDIKESVKVK